MKQPKVLFAGLLAGAALAGVLGTAITASAATTPLQGRIDVRPLTPSDIKDYGLTGAQGASGLATVGVGTPVYLDAQVNVAIPASNIVSVAWSLTTAPVGSQAVLTNSPLGTNVPIYTPADRLTYQVAGRQFLRPDRTGQYVVTATITTTSSGSTNLTQKITAGTYMGVQTCQLCHSGGFNPENIVGPWSKTLHATKFTRGINGQVSGYSKNCISCHVVGYDVNTNAVNGGFDDVATQLGWTFPTVLTNGNYEAMPSSLQDVANIQCENCHGPGSEHANAFGNTNLVNWPRISVSTAVGNCGQCHDAKTHHVGNPEWAVSMHATPVTTPSGAGRESCVRCHTGRGFIDYISGSSTTNAAYEPITCAACHDPHDATNPRQLRGNSSVTLFDNKTVITADKVGTGLLCMNCHMSRRDATNYVEVTAGSGGFGPHHGPQTDMFMGVNAITYGKNIPSSAHRDAITNACVTCHMQPTPATTDPAFLHAGGHTFGLSYSNNGTNVDLVGACAQCHGPIKSFDIARQDFDGDGVVEGAQTEVKGLLSQLSYLLPPVGTVKQVTATSIGAPAISINSSWTKQQLKAAYNYMFVVEDRSFGVHNLAYTVGLLKASIADLTGDANNDGMADWWQIKYFGSITDPRAAANACPANDGIPNWLKYNLGLDPMTPGVTLPDGVIWANGGSTGSTNAVQIYTAAEVAFDTQVGTTYQIQAISNLTGTWTNVGGPIAGNGKSFSYVTPTRSNAQQFYRVTHTP